MESYHDYHVHYRYIVNKRINYYSNFDYFTDTNMSYFYADTIRSAKLDPLGFIKYTRLESGNMVTSGHIYNGQIWILIEFSN